MKNYRIKYRLDGKDLETVYAGNSLVNAAALFEMIQPEGVELFFVEEATDGE